jgi:hypothetical protein
VQITRIAPAKRADRINTRREISPCVFECIAFLLLSKAPRQGAVQRRPSAQALRAAA